MHDFTLIMGNKNYSPWSLTAWLTAKTAGIDFDEIVIPLNVELVRSKVTVLPLSVIPLLD